MDLPRVTEVLRAYTGIDHIPDKVLKNAAERGTAVHGICQGIAEGAWVPDEQIDPHLRGYVASFRQWAEAQVRDFAIVEERYADEDLGYTGRIDFVVEGNDGCIYLVDIKTSERRHKTYPVQMAAYEELLCVHGIVIDGAMLVHLNKDGEFPEIYLLENLREEREVFFAALKCYNYFNRKAKKNGRK